LNSVDRPVKPGDDRERLGDRRERPGDDRERRGDRKERPGDRRERPGGDREDHAVLARLDRAIHFIG
jgi:hypothetical protein